jgi:hypothetical protein
MCVNISLKKYTICEKFKVDKIFNEKILNKKVLTFKVTTFQGI